MLPSDYDHARSVPDIGGPSTPPHNPTDLRRWRTRQDELIYTLPVHSLPDAATGTRSIAIVFKPLREDVLLYESNCISLYRLMARAQERDALVTSDQGKLLEWVELPPSGAAMLQSGPFDWTAHCEALDFLRAESPNMQEAVDWFDRQAFATGKRVPLVSADVDF